MRNRTLTIALLAAVFLAIGGCSTTVGPGGTGAGGETEQAPTAPQVGEKYLNGKLTLKSITVPESGGSGQAASLVLKNESTDILRDVVAIVIFYYPASSEMVSFDTEGIQDFFKVPSLGEHSINVIPSIQNKLLGMSVEVSTGTDRLPPTVAGERGVPGSKFLGGKLECVGVNDQFFSANPTVGFEVRNITSETVQFLEYKLVLRLRRNGQSVETEWTFDDRAIAPGGSIELAPSVGAVQRGLADYILLIRGAEL